MILLDRRPIWWKKKNKIYCTCQSCVEYYGLKSLDVTIKSAKGLGGYFTPSWQMVMDHKNGKISDQEYKNMYINILNSIPSNIYDELYEFGQERNGIIFLCYCPDGKFCHTHLLANYLADRFPDKYNVAIKILDF